MAESGKTFLIELRVIFSRRLQIFSEFSAIVSILFFDILWSPYPIEVIDTFFIGLRRPLFLIVLRKRHSGQPPILKDKNGWQSRMAVP